MSEKVGVAIFGLCVAAAFCMSCRLLDPYPSTRLNLGEFALFDPGLEPNSDVTGEEVFPLISQIPGVVVNNLNCEPAVVGGGDWFSVDLVVKGVPSEVNLIGLGVSFHDSGSPTPQNPMVIWVQTEPTSPMSVIPDSIVSAKVTIQSEACESIACHSSKIYYYALLEKAGRLFVSQPLEGTVVLRCASCRSLNCIRVISDALSESNDKNLNDGKGGCDGLCSDCSNYDVYGGPCSEACHHFVDCGGDDPPVCCSYVDPMYRSMNDPPRCVGDDDETESLFLAMLGIGQGAVQCEEAEELCRQALEKVFNEQECAVPLPE